MFIRTVAVWIVALVLTLAVFYGLDHAVMSAQGPHSLQGVGVGPFSQFSALANRRAVVVFPTPRTPVNRNAWATRLAPIAFASVRATCS